MARNCILVFTGHSLGAALAIMAATMAEAESWPRVPDAVVAFAAPRVGDEGLSQWWESRNLCKKLLRVSVYNDVITYMPFMEPLQLMDSLNYCFQNVMSCVGQLASGPKSLHPSERWTHVCPSSELFVPGAVKGVNAEMQDFSLLGGALAHFIGNALFGYSFGVLPLGLHTALSSRQTPSLPNERTI
ncbi:Lipase [Symbiodinium pilosum]|uniref:Lipase protein n=1 Tax=Symbiodinium pilosum TaxID=2952 RepID=A0A812VUF9_SYMPI|nr:Lipase [Symbiodinium pilosum]